MLLHFFGNITNTFNQLAKKPEYTVSVEGSLIFPNSTLENIVDKYYASTIHITELKYNLLGFNVTVHDKKYVNLIRIDASKTMMDIPIMLTSNVLITNGIIHLTYGHVDSGSIFDR